MLKDTLYRLRERFKNRNPKSYNIRKLNELTKQNNIPNFTIDEKNNIVETQEGIKFDVRLIEPYIFVETFGSYIHNKLEIVGSNRVVLDAGACFGDTALYFASKECKVFAVEPNPKDYNALLKNLELNQELKQRVTPINAAIGSDGEMEFKYDDTYIDGGGSAYSADKLGKKTKVKSFSLAGIMRQLNLSDIDYLKMDCKGAEDTLTVEELKKIKYAAKIEYTNTDPRKLEELKQKMSQAGFTFTIYKHNPGDSLDISNHGTILGTRASA